MYLLTSLPVLQMKDRESIPKTVFQKVIFLHFLVLEPNHLHSARRITLNAIVMQRFTMKRIFSIIEISCIYYDSTT